MILPVKKLILVALLLFTLEVFAQKQPLPALHHPVGIRFPAGMKAPPSFPLGKQKELVCDTCHGIKNLDQIPLPKVNSKAKNFLRNGPYPVLLGFCGNCHAATRKQPKRPDPQSPRQANIKAAKQASMRRFNIHHMLDMQGRIIEKNCSYCHVNTPDPDKVRNWRKLRFRIPPEKLCFGCHLKTTHLNAVQHQVKPSQKVLTQLHRSEKQKQIHLPLDRHGKMMCVTCHSPHPQGLIKGKAGKQVAQGDEASGIQYGAPNYWSKVFEEDKKERWKNIARHKQKLAIPKYQPIHKEVLLRLPAKDGQLCRACHKFKD